MLLLLIFQILHLCVQWTRLLRKYLLQNSPNSQSRTKSSGWQTDWQMVWPTWAGPGQTRTAQMPLKKEGEWRRGKESLLSSIVRVMLGRTKKKEETCCQYLIFIYVFILNSYLRSYFKIPFQEQSRSTASYGHSKLWVPSYWFSWRVYAAFLRNISAKLKEKVFSLFPVPRSSLFVFKLSVWFLARWVKVTLAVGEDGEGGAERQRLATDTDILTLEQPGRVTGWWWVELGETALFIC